MFWGICKIVAWRLAFDKKISYHFEVSHYKRKEDFMITTDYLNFRYEGELTLVKILEEDFALKNYYDIFDNEEELKKVVNSLLSSGVKLNKVIAPRLYDICKNVKEKLNYTEEIDFFVISSVEFNAFSVNGFGYMPHMICLNSALIQFFTDEELAFVIGHEIGHLMFLHSQLRVVRMLLSDSETKSIPNQIIHLFYRWFQYAEISSDRMGFIAQPNLETIGKVFFKLASGLSEEHLKFDIRESMKQMDNMKDMSSSDFHSSHPNNLVRLKCLELFSHSELYKDCTTNLIKKDELQAETQKVLDMLEYHPQNEDQKAAVEFLSSVGMLMACCDGNMNPKEIEVMYDFLSEFTSQPYHYLNFNDIQEIKNRTTAICAYYVQSKNDYKYI
jgi:predicted SprT family Zn-dependent metalloprotease